MECLQAFCRNDGEFPYCDEHGGKTRAIAEGLMPNPKPGGRKDELSGDNGWNTGRRPNGAKTKGQAVPVGKGLSHFSDETPDERQKRLDKERKDREKRDAEREERRKKRNANRPKGSEGGQQDQGGNGTSRKSRRKAKKRHPAAATTTMAAPTASPSSTNRTRSSSFPTT